jgi:hypothetical protein
MGVLEAREEAASAALLWALGSGSLVNERMDERKTRNLPRFTFPSTRLNLPLEPNDHFPQLLEPPNRHLQTPLPPISRHSPAFPSKPPVWHSGIEGTLGGDEIYEPFLEL